MSFAWTYLEPGSRVAGRSETFPDRDAAEEWIASAWPDLLAKGIQEVVLVELGEGQKEGRDLYRMGLGPAGG